MLHDKIRRARRLRRVQSVPEAALWSRLRGRQLGGLKFRRQQPIGPYVADFYCADAKLVVELDGQQHDRAHDTARDAWMREDGLEVLRFGIQEWQRNQNGVLEFILRRARERIAELGEKES